MHLERSRNALRLAEQNVEELRAVKNDPDAFQDIFGRTLAMVLAVGTTIDDESQGPRFKAWWTETRNEPMVQFMREVRAAAHKYGRRRATRVVFASASLGFQIGGSATAQVIDRDGRLVEDSEPASPLREPPPPEPPKASTDLPPQWEFVGEGKFKGGEFDGQEVFGFLDRYLAWLRDYLIPTAERLTT